MRFVGGTQVGCLDPNNCDPSWFRPASLTGTLLWLHHAVSPFCCSCSHLEPVVTNVRAWSPCNSRFVSSFGGGFLNLVMPLNRKNCALESPWMFPPGTCFSYCCCSCSLPQLNSSGGHRVPSWTLLGVTQSPAELFRGSPGPQLNPSGGYPVPSWTLQGVTQSPAESLQRGHPVPSWTLQGVTQSPAEIFRGSPGPQLNSSGGPPVPRWTLQGVTRSPAELFRGSPGPQLNSS